jgi:hypothetical protein
MSNLMFFNLETRVRSAAKSIILISTAISLFFGALAAYATLNSPEPLKQREPHVVFACAALCGLALLFAWLAVGGIRELRNPRRNTVYKDLAKLGPVEEMITQLESEVRTSGHELGGYIFTPNFLFDTGFLRVNSYRDLLWIYKKHTRHSVNFVPTGSTYQVVLCLRGGAVTERTAHQQVVDQVLALLAAGCPWIATGWTAELEELWQRSPAEFADAVDARYSSMPGPS